MFIGLYTTQKLILVRISKPSYKILMSVKAPTRAELLAACRERGLKGYSGKTKAALEELLSAPPVAAPVAVVQDTGKFRTNGKDQFYTSPSVATRCVETILKMIPEAAAAAGWRWIEPSAGAGVFLRALPAGTDAVGVDIDPRAPEIVRADFLTWVPPTGKPMLLFGNPPFGRQSSLAKAFIKKGCGFAAAIAFILPKSFTKPSMSRAFAPQFHCTHSEELGKNAFVLNGEAYDVPCVFQIWERRADARPVVESIAPFGYTYVKPTEEYSIALRRVGGLAGKCFARGSADFAVQAHYFLRFDTAVAPHAATIIENTNAHVFPSNTVGPRSLSKSEVNVVLNDIIQRQLLPSQSQ